MQRLIQLSMDDDDLFWLRFLLLKAAASDSRVPKDTLARLTRQLDCSARARIPAPEPDGDPVLVTRNAHAILRSAV